ncbi:MAG TPA: TonB family protein [Candidatus Acidoferrales bacterium]|nr:TonB family protein [Candidatus Acidoferrales bacterium]
MPDPARTAEAKVLEVPVTIQGSKIVAGTDHRELFTETTKTQLVFDGGAAVNLEARVVAGQSLFLRNEVTRREILCRVLEAPAMGQTGPTELEFTVPEEGFWDTSPEQIQAASERVAAEKSAADQAAATVEAPAEKSETPSQAHVDSTLAMMGTTASNMTVPPKRTSIQEELMASHEAAPEKPSATSAAGATETHQEVIPAHEQPNVQTTSGEKGPEAAPEFNLKKFEDTLAALLDGDARRARRAASGKEKAPAKAAAGDVTMADEHAEPGGEAPAEPEEIVPKITIEQRLTTGRGAVITGACASAVIAVCLFLIARAVFYPKSYEIERPARVAMKPNAPVGPQKPGAKPAATVAVAKPPASAGKHSGASSPSIPVAKNSVPPAAPEGVAKAVKPVESEAEPAGPRVVVSRSAITVDTGTREDHRKQEPDANGDIPAKIVSQVQPIYPSWAKSLDVNGVVTLDATIDTRGNITETKVLSGPRELQHAAEQAVGLWIFEPAKANGVPVASHMTLTVEFQR